MRVLAAIITVLMISFGSVVAGADGQEVNIDTLIIEPHQAGDLPDEVVAWLEARDFLIPIACDQRNNAQYDNTLIGSFLGENTKDCAVLTIPRGALEDSCSLWVFPSGDTLSPMLVAKHKRYQWWRCYYKPQLDYAWRIGPFGPYSKADLQQLRVDLEGLPEISHQGIFIGLTEKDPGPYYYYNGNQWLQVPLGQ